MLRYRFKRIVELFSSAVYRRVLISRILCYLLRRLNPNLKYLGLADKETTTFLFLDDNVVTPYSIAVGNFQKSDLDTVIRLCKKHSRFDGDIFLDVGANIGTTTLYAMNYGIFKRALCFEPAPANQQIFRLNMFANGFTTEQVKLLNIGVSDKQTEMTLYISDANHGDHRLNSKPVSTIGNTIQVTVETLDHILINEGIDPKQVGLVWIDTQGHEGHILKSANSLIENRVPFCIEFWPQALTESGCYEQLLNILEDKFEFFIALGSEQTDALIPISKIRSFAKRFEGTIFHTDILVFPR